MFPIRLRITDVTTRAAEDLGFAVAIEVDEPGRLIIEHVENDVPLPMTLAAFGVFVPGSFLAGKSVDQNIGPSIRIEIIRERKKTFRVGIVRARRSLETRN